MSLGIYNNIHLNKFGEETFLSRMEKTNEQAVSQDTLIDKDDKFEIQESELTEKLKEEEIARKIAKGQTVSLKEAKYIKKHNPELLKAAKGAKEEKDKVKEEIRAAKDENEADIIISGENLKALTSMASGKGDTNIEGKLENEALQELKKEVLYNRIDKLV